MSKFSRLNWILSEQFGLSPKKFLRAITQIPWYIRSLIRFQLESNSSVEIMPCLHDRFENSGTVNSEYFWQDLFVAQKIFSSTPSLHCDIGSRIDGFVAHVASFRILEVIDIRPSPHVIPNVKFTRMDLMADDMEIINQYDSISCLHALEHFGLGRYGDLIDPSGWKKGLNNIVSILAIDGVLYLSVPVGKPCVVFNAHRIFAIDQLISEMEFQGLTISALHFVEPGKPGVNGGDIEESIKILRRMEYVLAIIISQRTT
jgi:hypothetical protein